jgi:hypothetical protein
MPKLSELTDYQPEEQVTPSGRLYVSPNIPTSDDGDYFSKPVAPMPELPSNNVVERIIKKLAETEFSPGTDMGNKLAGTGGQERYQLWPEKIVRSALTAIPDAYSGKIPMHDVDPETGELVPSQAMIGRAMDMASFAGVGGIGGTGEGAGTSLGIVPVDVAKKLNFRTAEHPDILKQAIENTPAASVDADGHLVVKVTRNQHPDQEGVESVRGGVFYLPEGSKDAKYYSGKNENFQYGGTQNISGETAFKNPLVVKGATGGKAPEAAYNQLMGDKKAYENMRTEALQSSGGWLQGLNKGLKIERISAFLEKYAPEMAPLAEHILDSSSKGNQLPYALQEAAVASAARNAGHDGVIGYSVGRGASKGKPFLSEIYDVRENRYPSSDGDFSVHPELYADSSKPAAAIQAVDSSRRAFLRPALKYKDRLYKGKEGQEHQDVIPPHLYPEFQQMAMNGEDISHYNFGFVNDKGHFLSREDALKYGIDTGLIDPQAGKFGALTSTLMADSSKPGTAIEAMAKTASEPAQPFYSALEHNVNAISQNKMNGEAWLGTLANKPGVKPEELDWTGLRSFLEENKGKPVTKEQVQEHLQNNKVELKEVSKGTSDPRAIEAKKAFEDYGKELRDKYNLNPLQNLAMYRKIKGMTDEEVSKYTQLQQTYHDLNEAPKTKYHSYQLPGGENYREMLMTTPVKTSPKTQEGLALTKRMNDGEFNSLNDADRKALFAKRDALLREGKAEEGTPYKSSHWDEPNILAHVRMNDRTIDGKKSLHLEEIQSDWHQQGREKGYADSSKPYEVFNPVTAEIKGKYATQAEAKKAVEGTNLDYGKSEGVPDAPFKKTWHELALKRMLREAAEKGYDRLSWTPGEAQAARYDLSKSVDSLLADPNKDGTFTIVGRKNGSNAFEQKNVTADKLPDIVGKEAAKNLLSADKNKYGMHELSGQQLKIGGEGMKGFYDQIIPKALEKLGKEHGVKVKSHMLETNPKGWHITPPSETVSGKWMVKSNDYNSKGYHFDTKAEAEANLAQNIAGERAAQPVHYIDIPQALKDKAMQKGFPLFSTAMPGYMFKPVNGNPFENDK